MTIDSIPTRGGAPLLLSVSLVCATALLSGCMGSPTYGTGKTANEQLLEDVTGVLQVGPRDRGPEIAYNPRPDLVKPSSLEVLPPPQEELAAAGNPAWPESPEQRRARIRAEATANQDNPNYRPQVRPGMASSGGAGVDVDGNRALTATMAPDSGRRAELQRRVRQNNQGEATSRRYLSEPPLDYRRPSDTAAVGELGEEEWKKERQAKRAQGERTWRDYIPGL